MSAKSSRATGEEDVLTRINVAVLTTKIDGLKENADLFARSVRDDLTKVSVTISETETRLNARLDSSVEDIRAVFESYVKSHDKEHKEEEDKRETRRKEDKDAHDKVHQASTAILVALIGAIATLGAALILGAGRSIWPTVGTVAVGSAAVTVAFALHDKFIVALAFVPGIIKTWWNK